MDNYLLLFNYNIQNYLTIILIIMSEGAEVERDVLTLELGDLKETLVSTENKWQVGEGLTKTFKKGGAKVPTSLPLLLLLQ